MATTVDPQLPMGSRLPFQDSLVTSTQLTEATMTPTTTTPPPMPPPPSFDTPSDLSNYVGIGALECNWLLHDWNLTTHHVAVDGWLEFPAPPFDLSLDTGKKLQLLFSKGLVKLTFSASSEKLVARLYVLPSDAEFPSRHLSVMNHILSLLDVSREAWNAEAVTSPTGFFGVRALGIKSSLFAMFNSLPSPRPKWRTGTIHDDVLARLRYGEVEGLKTNPFEYQRRSAALMLEREVVPEEFLDPFLQPRLSPYNQKEYYVLSGHSKSPSQMILKSPIYVKEGVRGGILAEEMGTGKTLICLMLMLASRHYSAEMPTERIKKCHSVPSLMEICSKVVLTKSVPWTDELLEIPHPIKNHITSIRERLKPDSYRVLRRKVSMRANIFGGEYADVYLSRGTIVVVPPNLINQWEEEIHKHCEGLHYIKLMDRDEIPHYTKLIDLDLILITRARFDKEVAEDTDSKGRRKSTGVATGCDCDYIGATRIRDCTCPKEGDFYQSPLTRIHWKRLIVDEGHTTASSKTNTSEFSSRLHVQSRWAVTGTPTTSLFTAPNGLEAEDTETEDSLGDFVAAEANDLRKIGNILRHYLKSRIIVRGEKEDWRNREWPSSLNKSNAHIIWNAMERTMIRHQIGDIEREISLPPLKHSIISLQPGYLEKLSMNLFLAAFTTNAVTSEREDQDYMFHPSQRAALNSFVNNLRTATVYWSAFEDVEKTVNIARKYLQKSFQGLNKCTPSDRALLEDAIHTSENALNSVMWNSISSSHDMGYYISNLPVDISHAWSINGSALQDAVAPYCLLGGSQVPLMQKYVSSYAFALDLEPSIRSLKTEGERISTEFREKLVKKAPKSSGMSGKDSKPLASSRKKDGVSPVKQKKNSKSSPGGGKGQKGILKNEPKTPSFTIDLLPRDSPFRHAQIVGTASAKLSYLLDRIIELSPSEKIIVFFESETIAYYIAEALDIIAIPYLLYTRTLDIHRKSEYLVSFNTTSLFRVMILDIRQASHGINLYSASRMFFLSPLWRSPSIEAQALKRSHRIGQTRPVFVETLVLKGTIEEDMLKRRQSMSELDFKSSKSKFMMDDVGLRNILSEARFIQGDGGAPDSPVPSKLVHPQLLFGEGKTGETPENPDIGIVKLSNSKIQTINRTLSPAIYDNGEGPSGRRTRMVGFADDNELDADESMLTLRATAPESGNLESTGAFELSMKSIGPTRVREDGDQVMGTSVSLSPDSIEDQLARVRFSLPLDSSPEVGDSTNGFKQPYLQEYPSITTAFTAGINKRGPDNDGSLGPGQPEVMNDDVQSPQAKRPRVRFADD